jgi:hypothetical protein
VTDLSNATTVGEVFPLLASLKVDTVRSPTLSVKVER